MPGSIDKIIEEAVSKVMASVIPAIQRQIASMAAGEVEKNLAVRHPRRGRRVAVRRVSRPRNGEITKWVADKRARRVPNFVIELTGGLDTKKKIVAKYGEDAAFEKGKPAPKPEK